MGHVHFLLNEMGLDEMGLDKMALNLFFHSSSCLFRFRGLAGVELTLELKFTGNLKISRDAIFSVDQHED